MQLNELQTNALVKLMHTASERAVENGDLREICELLDISGLYYDMDLGEDALHYRSVEGRKSVFGDADKGDKIILFDSGEKPGLTLTFPYFYGEREYVHAYAQFREGIRREDVSEELFRYLADIVYLIVSRQNMRLMLDFAEMTDAQTGIPNIVFTRRRFAESTRRFPDVNYVVIYVNLQNFNGDEVIVQYARILLNTTTEDECVCRMGGDNFVAFVRAEKLPEMLGRLKSVSIGHLKTAPNRSFEVSSWIGISEGMPHDPRPLGARLEEASIACNIGKTQLKSSVVKYSDELKAMMNRGREIIAMFRPAVANHEFHPFFQAKVNMATGELVGFEALCRWIHEGRFIYPDQFIPVLDKEGLIHDLDMTIFRETCAAIRRWKDMGLDPPRISSNFSRKNLFIPDIEKKIYDTISEFGIDVSDVEIEITESVKETETDRLIDFVKRLKEYGLFISIDDFGTGYSSLMLIHNIDADVVKIDKSFVDEIPGDHKSEVLIESIINIAHNLDMELIAEGVETEEQGRALLRLGCHIAQGYYYSKPVDYDAATKLIRESPFTKIN